LVNALRHVFGINEWVNTATHLVNGYFHAFFLAQQLKQHLKMVNDMHIPACSTTV
jgi:hypothetical protein